MSGYILLTRLYGLLGKPVLATIHGIAFAEARLKKQLKEKIVFYTNGWVELLLCPKNKIHLSNYSLHLHTTQQKDLTAIIPNAVKSTFFELPLKSSTENKLLFVGVIEHNKNLMYLLHCLAELNQQGIFFTLDVLGDFADANYKKNTLELIERAQLSKAVKFHGWVKQDQVLKFLHESDILVIPSLQETLPMAIAEAMAAGSDFGRTRASTWENAIFVIGAARIPSTKRDPTTTGTGRFITARAV
jgi:glycosyltransferase involved in cell wall biosynthesis